MFVKNVLRQTPQTNALDTSSEKPQDMKEEQG